MTNISWRDVLSIHPAAELFPSMSEDELRALGEDIKKNGLTSKVVLWRDGRAGPVLLDGRNRLDAIEMVIDRPVMVGPPSIATPKEFLACNKVIVLDKSVDPFEYVISANIHRRHLNVYERDELIAKLIKTDPTKSNRQIARIAKASHPHVGKVREQLEKTGDVETVTTSIDTKGRQQPAKKRRKPNVEPVDAEQAHRLITNRVARNIKAAPAARKLFKRFDQLSDETARQFLEMVRLICPYIIGPDSVRIEELENEKRQLELKVTGLESEIAELKAARKLTAKPDAVVDVIDPVSDIVAHRELKKQLAATSPYGRAGLICALRQLLDRLESGDTTALDPPPADDDGPGIPGFLQRV
jgi:hypothetical protein